ncbi:MAG: hypothetical protein V3R98_09810, partial [Alphaproteobacteria bacterium]
MEDRNGNQSKILPTRRASYPLDLIGDARHQFTFTLPLTDLQNIDSKSVKTVIVSAYVLEKIVHPFREPVRRVEFEVAKVGVEIAITFVRSEIFRLHRHVVHAAVPLQ